MVIGTDLVLTWVSIIPVGSLGLRLGRDWLDGVGCALSFSKKIMLADHKHIPLHQLAAGHFALRLIPPGWPRPRRRVGLDEVVASQISHHDWLHWKLLAVQSVNHDYLLSEHSVCAAKLVGMCVHEGDSVDLSRSMALLKARTLLGAPGIATRSTRSSLTSRNHGQQGHRATPFSGAFE